MGVAAGVGVNIVASPKLSGAPPELLVMDMVLGRLMGAGAGADCEANAGTVFVVTVMLLLVAPGAAGSITPGALGAGMMD